MRVLAVYGNPKHGGFVIRRFMLKPNPDGVYDHVIEQWRQRGLL